MCFIYSFYNDKPFYKILAKLRNIQILLVLSIMQLDKPKQTTEYRSRLLKLVGFDSYLSFGLLDSDSDADNKD